jgi:hypothetical protein
MNVCINTEFFIYPYSAISDKEGYSNIYSTDVIFNLRSISIAAVTYSDVEGSDFYAQKLST